MDTYILPDFIDYYLNIIFCTADSKEPKIRIFSESANVTKSHNSCSFILAH